jgi:hypothetical protein
MKNRIKLIHTTGQYESRTLVSSLSDWRRATESGPALEVDPGWRTHHFLIPISDGLDARDVGEFYYTEPWSGINGVACHDSLLVAAMSKRCLSASRRPKLPVAKNTARYHWCPEAPLQRGNILSFMLDLIGAGRAFECSPRLEGSYSRQRSQCVIPTGLLPLWAHFHIFSSNTFRLCSHLGPWYKEFYLSRKLRRGNPVQA